MNRETSVTHLYWLNTILIESKDDLNTWEHGFVTRISIHLNNKWPISDKQETTLEELYEKKTR